jgi:hypothetical protein
MTCHPERTGPQTPFSPGVPKERSLLFGVESGGGESKDLRLHFGISAANFGDRTLEGSDSVSGLPATSRKPQEWDEPQLETRYGLFSPVEIAMRVTASRSGCPRKLTDFSTACG